MYLWLLLKLHFQNRVFPLHVLRSAVTYCLCPSDAVWQERIQLYRKLVLIRLLPSVTSLMWQILKWKESEKGGITSARERLDSPHISAFIDLFFFNIPLVTQIYSSRWQASCQVHWLGHCWCYELYWKLISLNESMWLDIWYSKYLTDIFNCSLYNSFVIIEIFLITS